MNAHATKDAAEIEDAIDNGITDFVVPGYYWTGGRLIDNGGTIEKLNRVHKQCSFGFRITAPDVKSAIAKMTSVCNDYDEFLHFKVELTSTS